MADNRVKTTSNRPQGRYAREMKGVATMARNYYELTEERLEALKPLKFKAIEDEKRLERLTVNSPEHTNLKTAIQADRAAIEEINRALEYIKDDRWAVTVTKKYIEGLSDEEIADELSCDKTTVWRNRKRLIQKISVLFYGIRAIAEPAC